MIAGTLIGIWALAGVLSGASGTLAVIDHADWAWVLLTFVLGQLPIATNAWVVTGAVPGPIPFWRCLALETANQFTYFVTGDAGVFALRVRFFHCEDYDSATAVSSGAIASGANWLTKAVLVLVSLIFAHGDFHVPPTSGSHRKIVWLVMVIVVVVSLLAAVVAIVPRARHLVSARVAPYLASIWKNMRDIAAQPAKVISVLVGSAASQVLLALALGAALHAVGGSASLATLIVVISLASIVGGIAPVPGGAGVIEAGLVMAGIPQDQATAAAIIERLCTAYLPLIWGWVALVIMRHRHYI